MIFFAAPKAHIWEIEDYLASPWGTPMARRITPVTYESLQAARRAPAGAWILTSFDRLSPGGMSFARHLTDALIHADCRVLNHPDRALLRQPLLDLLYREGINTFRAFPAACTPTGVRFPVFVREANEHNGPLTPLLHSTSEIRNALAALRLRGHHPGELMTVEFCDTGRDGIYRKFAAFCLAGRVLARNVNVGTDWMVKSTGAMEDDTYALEECRYALENPHRELLERVFALAGTEYGRVDYALLDGRPQIWEINTNPTMTRRRGKPGNRSERYQQLIDPGRVRFHASFQEAFDSIDRDFPPGAEIPLEIPDWVYAQLQEDARRLDEQSRRRALLMRVADLPGLRALQPILKPAARKMLALWGRL